MRFLPLLVPLLAACSTVHGVRPLGKGGVAIEASLGGPFVEVFDAPIPLPLSTVGAAVGVTDGTDVHAAWHPSALALFGLGAVDAGVSQQLLAQKGARPRLMGDLTVVGAFGDAVDGAPEGGVRVWAQPTATAAWDWGKHGRQTAYGSLLAFLQPAPTFAWHPAVAVGNQWALGSHVRVGTELKWIAPLSDAEVVAPHWYAPGDLGAVSAQVGLGLVFGGGK